MHVQEQQGPIDHAKFPIMLLYEHGDGSVCGAFMRGKFSALHKIATEFVEPEDVLAAIEHVRGVGLGSLFYGLCRESNIDALSLQEAIRLTPESARGQKFVFIFRDFVWQSGIWNNPSKLDRSEPLLLSTYADFHGTPVSRLRRDTRSGIEVVRAAQTLAGDYALLQRAVGLVSEKVAHDSINYENHPAVKLLCEWWNDNAPDGMRSAGLFRIYVWDAANRCFIAGDPEEPACLAEAMVHDPSYALFEQNGEPPVVISFLRGGAFNVEDSEGLKVFYANGETAYCIGLPPGSAWDESYYTMVGLLALKDVCRSKRAKSSI